MDIQASGKAGIALARIITGILLLLGSWLAQAAGVIDTVDIDDSDNPATIRIDFTIPLQYINHAPENAGDELNIQFKSVGSSAFSVQSEASDQQTVVAARTRRVPLIDARYDSVSADRGVLTLRFSRQVSYTVYPGADRRHILVKVITPENVLDQRKSIVPPPATAPVPSGKKSTINLTHHYVVNLESSIKDTAIPSFSELPERERYIVYTARFPIDGRVWNRLRIGFFETRAEAQQLLNKLKQRYPGAWVAYASAKEINAAYRGKQKPRRPAPKPVPAIIPTLPKTPDEKIAALMEEARQAIAGDKVSHAIQLYTKILRYPDNPYRQDALEFLGVARERKGQSAHAIKEYERYLALYPEGEGAERVRQRLAGLTTATRRPSPLESRRKRRSGSRNPWDIYGGVSQFYRRDESITEVGGDVTTQSSLATDLDVTARKRSRIFDIQTRFTGSYLYDFLDDGTGNTSSISSLYVDTNQKKLGLSARLGRQSRNTGGVLGRFDGLLAGYRMTNWLTINGVAGFPVFSTRDAIKTDRYLYGLSADLGTFANAWDFNVFIIEQQNDGILDRRAIGGEARYFDPVHSLLSFVDYDISYDSLNTLILLGTWTLPDRTTINASVDYRNSPILTTSNALQGQTVRNIDALLNSLTEDQIRQLAEDRTADVTTVTLGANHPLTAQYQVSGDVTLSRLSGTNSSGGIEGIPGTGNEYFYNLQLIGSNLMTRGDISVLGLRYSDTSTSQISSLTVNTRYPIKTVWRINPRFRLDYRDNSNNDTTQWIAAPSLRIDYRWRKRYRFEAEGGGEWSTQDLPDSLGGNSEQSSSWFVNIGYRADF